MPYEIKPLKQKSLPGISDQTLAIHHGKLYSGYVNKANEIGEKLQKLREEIFAGKESGNTTYSALRGLKEGETFAVNGIYLHENYFGILGNKNGDWQTAAPELAKAMADQWGSVEDGIKYFNECAMAARGWSILCWDPHVGTIKQYNGDAHNQGGVWGCPPIIAIDVYEHAYFIDHGSDRQAYLEAFWKNLDWAKAEELYKKVREIRL